MVILGPAGTCAVRGVRRTVCSSALDVRACRGEGTLCTAVQATGRRRVTHMKGTRILTPREVHQLRRVHARISALLAANGATPVPRRQVPPKAKVGPSRSR